MIGLTSTTDFIQVYDDALSDEQCDELIRLYKNDYRKEKGKSGGGVVKEQYKISTDVCLLFSKKEQYNDIIIKPLNDALRQYADKYHYLNDINEWQVADAYNIQAYKEGEGFGKLHCENQGYTNVTQSRMLAWMIYLNNAKSGTVFPYQKKTLQPKKGSCAIWPAYWTHPHYGVVPNKGFKIIATGWCSFNI